MKAPIKAIIPRIGPPGATETERQRIARCLRERKCVICEKPPYHQTAYVCRTHRGWGVCPLCGELWQRRRMNDGYCHACETKRPRKGYASCLESRRFWNKLRDMQKRQRTTFETIFCNLRQRITLADLVRRTPGLTWHQRATLLGPHERSNSLERRWRNQNRGPYDHDWHVRLAREAKKGAIRANPD